MERTVYEVHFTFSCNSITYSGRIWLNHSVHFHLCSYTIAFMSFCFTQNSSIFMAVYTIRLLIWWMMDDSGVIWPRQRFPLIALSCQYKWQQKMFLGRWGRGELSSFTKETVSEIEVGKQIRLSAVILIHLQTSQQCAMREGKLPGTGYLGRNREASRAPEPTTKPDLFPLYKMETEAEGAQWFNRMNTDQCGSQIIWLHVHHCWILVEECVYQTADFITL